MKTFEDLVFRPWGKLLDVPYEVIFKLGRLNHTQAVMEFKNGYGVSVLCGDSFYSNGIDTYEVAVTKDGKLCYDTPITDDVLGWQTKEEVTEIMKALQEYE